MNFSIKDVARWLGLLSFLFVGGCGFVEAGQVQTRVFPLLPADYGMGDEVMLAVGGSPQISIGPGSIDQVEVTADVNALDQIQVAVGMRGENFIQTEFLPHDVQQNVQLDIGLRSPLRALSIRENSVADIETQFSPELSLAATNRAELRARGECKGAVLLVTENAFLDLRFLVCEDVTVQANEKTRSFVHAQKTFRLDLADQAEANLLGPATIVEESLQGEASYRRGPMAPEMTELDP